MSELSSLKNGDLETPVVFIIFNRPGLTKKVFEQIKKAKPKQLFIIADGPRTDEERTICLATQKIVEEIDWDCQVERNYAEKNLGCGRRVSSGLDWVFSKVEQAIILEDDCLPSISFFYFCQELLVKYRDNKNIMHISGFYEDIIKENSDYTYFYSRMPRIWGWATWRRSWLKYDFEIKNLDKMKLNKVLSSLFKNRKMVNDILDSYDTLIAGKIDLWDWQWAYTIFMNDGISIAPYINLVNNMGYRGDITSVIGTTRSVLVSNPTHEIGKIKHPIHIKINITQDKNYHFLFYNRYFNEKICYIIGKCGIYLRKMCPRVYRFFKKKAIVG